MGNEQSLFLSTTLAYFYPRPVIVSLTKSTPTQRAFPRTLPESPLPSQKQAKLVSTHKTCFIYTKPVFTYQIPVLTRIAAPIAKISEACFYPQNLFYLPKPAFIQSSGLFLPTKPVFIQSQILTRIAAPITKTSEAYFYPLQLLSTHKARFYLKPVPYQNRRSNRKISEACFIHQSLFLSTKACLIHEACFIYTKPVFI